MSINLGGTMNIGTQNTSVYTSAMSYSAQQVSTQSTSTAQELQTAYQELSPEQQNNVNNQITDSVDERQTETAETRDNARQVTVTTVQQRNEKDLIATQLDAIDGSIDETNQPSSVSINSVIQEVNQHQRIKSATHTYQTAQELSVLHEQAQSYNNQSTQVQAYSSVQYENGQALNTTV